MKNAVSHHFFFLFIYWFALFLRTCAAMGRRTQLIETVKHLILRLLSLFNLALQITVPRSCRVHSCLWVNIFLQAPSGRHIVAWSAKNRRETAETQLHN